MRATQGRNYHLRLFCNCGNKSGIVWDGLQVVEMRPYPYFTAEGLKKLCRVGKCGQCGRGFLYYGAPLLPTPA